jgi:hypothetical protein
MTYNSKRALKMVNHLLEKLNTKKRLSLEGRYGYKAIDWENHNVLKTGLTNKQACMILESIESVLNEIVYKT